MKRMKFLFVLALTVCMLFTVAFAEGEFVANDIEYSGTGNIVVTLSSDVYTSGYELNGQATFDTTKFEYVESNSTSITYSTKRSRVNIVGASLATPLTFTLKPLVADVNNETIALASIKIIDASANIKYSVDSYTIKITTATPSEPDEPVITTVSKEKGASVEKDNVIYTNIFKGKYSATPTSDVAISKIGIKYHPTDVNAADAKDLSKSITTIEGGATVTFDVAILGVTSTTDIAVAPYTVYDFAN